MKRAISLVAIVASAVCCIFLAEHRAAVEVAAAPLGDDATCHVRGITGASAWTAYVCTVTKPAPTKPTYRTFTGGARGLSVSAEGVFAEIAGTYATGADDDGVPETIIVNAQVPTMRRPPSLKGDRTRSVIQLPDQAPDAQPQMILVPGLDQPGYDTYRRIFYLPAEASMAERVRMMFVLMAERR